MKKLLTLVAFLTLATLTFVACSDDDKITADLTNKKDSLYLQDYFIGGTLGSSNKSVFIVQFLENNKALFINSSSKYSGKYKQEDKLITMEVNDPGNYRIMKFLLDDKNQIRMSYYQALDNPYLTQASLIKLQDTNQLAGKKFMGAEYKWGKLNIEDYLYQFDEKGLSYGADKSSETITTDKRVELLNNSAFRYIDGKYAVIGYVAGDSLTVFKNDMLYYFGVFKQQ